jgi:hypothetical protein
VRILNKIFSTGIYNFQYVFQLRKLYALNSEFERKLDSNDARCVKMIDIGELSFGVNKGFSQSPKFIIPAKFNNILIGKSVFLHAIITLSMREEIPQFSSRIFVA